MDIDHILPEALGGLTVAENLWLACSLCNDYKNDRIAALDPETTEIVLLFHPRQERWADHFAWTDDGATMVGLTATGRATMSAPS